MLKICKKRVCGNEKIDLPCALSVCPRLLHLPLLRTEMKTGLVTVEIKRRSVQHNSEPQKLFYTSYSSIHFGLFLQRNVFLFYLNFSI